MSDASTYQFDPHYAEYLGAAEGMQETYGKNHPGRTQLIEGRLHTTWAVGDFVMFRTNDGGILQGTVIEVLVEDGNSSQYHIAAHIPGRGRQHFAVNNEDVLIF